MRQALCDILSEAGKELLKARSFSVSEKEGHANYVTDVDKRLQDMLMEKLHALCPEARFIGEERTNQKLTAEPTWVVDPIDGTSNFMRGHRLYTISIAYEHDGVLQIGCVYCPGTDELFLAIRGEGATLNGHPIHVADTPLRDAIVDLGFGHRIPENRERTMKVFPGLLSAISDVRRTGSAAYDLSCVASGRSDAFAELGLSLYDYAAGYVILTEAGGTFTGWDDGEDGLKTGNLLASNGVIHEALRSLLLGR